MKKSKSFVFLISIIFISLFIGITHGNKETIYSTMSLDKAEIKQGEKVSLEIKIHNPENINTYKAKLNYDENVWEKLDDNSFTSKNTWELPKYNPDNANFILINKQSSIDNTEVLTIELTALTNAPLGKTDISLDGISASDINKEYNMKELKTEINILASSNKEEPSKPVDPIPEEKPTEPINPNPSKENTKPSNIEENQPIPPSKEKPKNPQNPTGTNSNDKQDNIDTNKNEENKLTDKTEENSNKIIENTEETKENKKVIYIVLIVIILILFIILFSIYKKNTKQVLMILLIYISYFSNVLIVKANDNIFLGDANRNSIIDDNDIELLESHLIELSKISSRAIVDMNSDSKLTLVDLSLLIAQELDNPYDTYNVTGITSWTPIPIVSKELLDYPEVTTGGEGCQWPIGMSISEDGQLMLIGTDVGGIYRSTDGGKTYEQSNAGLNSRGAGAFAIDPNNSSYVIAIGINSYPYDSNGPHISEDGGITWKQTKSMLIKGHRDIRDAVTYDKSSYDLNKNRTMIAYWSTAYKTETNSLNDDNAGLYQTLDGGYTWTLINKDLYDGTIKINPQTGEVYVSKNDGIYYSNDKGATFTKIVNDGVTGFDLIESSGKVYLYYCNNEGTFICENGLSFSKISSTNFPQNAVNIKVSPVDKNKIIIISKEGDYQNYPYYSEDGGVTWIKSILDDSLSMMPYNNRASIPLWSPTINKVWLFVQGDFVSSSIDSGKTFKWDSNGITGILSGGLVHYNVYNPDIIYFGSQDYNGAITTDGGKTWKYINMSENRWGGFCYGGYAVDENTYFVGVSPSWEGVRRLKITFDGGKTIIDTGMDFTQENLRVSIESSYQSPTDPKVLFAADLRSDDGGRTWKKMNGCINVYTHNPKGQKELYGMDETAQYVVVSYDNGVTWKKVNNEVLQPNPNFAPLKIDDVAYDWKNNSVYVAAGWGYLYRISVQDGTQEYVINKYLPKYNVAPLNQKGSNVITKVAVDPNDPNIIYCGGAGNGYMNNSALYRSVDGGKSFQVITANTTNSIVKTGYQMGYETNSIEVNPITGEVLFAGGCFGISKLSPPYPIPVISKVSN